jgi:hypothetical protein
MRTILLIGIGGLLIGGTASATAGRQRSAGPDVPVEAVVARAAAYVAAFTEAFSNVVAEERYLQDVSSTGPGAKRGGRRVLRSDVVLLKVGGPLEWRPYRDVFEVDGKPVRDRDDRLMKLFQDPSASSFEQAARIARESARFNIGLASRTINTPVLSLLFLQRSIQPRFRFRLGRRDADAGPRTWVVDYREERRPTIVRGLMTDDSTDLPASGRFWIDADTGRVSKAELRFAVQTAEVGMRASLVTSFRHDDRLGIDVPVELREEYRVQNTLTELGATDKAEGFPTVTHSAQVTLVTGTAAYSNFRQFEVKADAVIAPGR